MRSSVDGRHDPLGGYEVLDVGRKVHDLLRAEEGILSILRHRRHEVAFRDEVAYDALLLERAVRVVGVVDQRGRCRIAKGNVQQELLVVVLHAVLVGKLEVVDDGSQGDARHDPVRLRVRGAVRFVVGVFGVVGLVQLAPVLASFQHRSADVLELFDGVVPMKVGVLHVLEVGLRRTWRRGGGGGGGAGNECCAGGGRLGPVHVDFERAVGEDGRVRVVLEV